MVIVMDAVAQSDTGYFYLGDYGLTIKDSASQCVKIYKTNGRWKGKTYDIKTGFLQNEGYYRDSSYNLPVGTFKNYLSDGVLSNITVLDQSSNLVSRTYFYKNGTKQSLVSMKDDGTYSTDCWDSLGNKQGGCTINAEARFPGGLKSWKKFLDKNMNDKILYDAEVPKGTYIVTVQFAVEKDGRLSHIQAVDQSGVCEACVTEVLEVFQKSPAWQPATLPGGEPFVFLASQNVSIIVAKEKKHK